MPLFYGQKQAVTLPSRRMDVYKAVQDVIMVRDRLGPEELSHFDVQHLKANAAAKGLAEVMKSSP